MTYYYIEATAPAMSADFLEITGGTNLEDGTVQVCYTANNNFLVMILKPVVSGCYILSNLELEE